MSAAASGGRSASLKEVLPRAAAIHAYIISGVSFQLVPLLIGAIKQSLDLTTVQVGAIPSSELAGLTAANLIGAALIRRMSWRWLTLAGWILWIAGNLSATLATAVGALLTLRFVAGVGTGMLSAVSMAALARLAAPERSFAAAAVIQALVAAACTLATPLLLRTDSWMAVYVMLALLGVPGLFLFGSLASLGRTSVASEAAADARRRFTALMFLGPLGVLLTYVAMSMVWTYYGEIGKSGGLSTQAIANALSAGAVAVVGVSLLVTAVGRRLPRPAAISASLIFTCSAVLMAFSAAKPWTFGFSVIVWTCGTGIFTPYAFAATAEVDPSGSATALAGALSGAGIAMGPLLAAPFLASVGIASIRILAPVFLVAGFVVLLPLLRKRQCSLMPAR